MIDIDFSHLTPTGTARFTLTGVCVPRTNPVSTTLVMKHAGRSNAGFTNAIMKIEGETGGARTVHTLDVGDEKSAAIFARHVVVGWEGPLGADGKPLPCTPENVQKLFAALIAAKRPDLVRAAFAFAGDADNFSDAAASSENLGKE